MVIQVRRIQNIRQKSNARDILIAPSLIAHREHLIFAIAHSTGKRWLRRILKFTDFPRTSNPHSHALSLILAPNIMCKRFMPKSAYLFARPRGQKSHDRFDGLAQMLRLTNLKPRNIASPPHSHFL